jgi:hypothetical protein
MPRNEVQAGKLARAQTRVSVPHQLSFIATKFSKYRPANVAQTLLSVLGQDEMSDLSDI